MSFVMEYFNKKIQSRMQSSEDRRKEWEENLTREAEKAKKTSAYLSLPTKPWGFWKNEKLTAKYVTNVDPTVSKMPGRSRPNVLD